MAPKGKAAAAAAAASTDTCTFDVRQGIFKAILCFDAPCSAQMVLTKIMTPSTTPKNFKMPVDLDKACLQEKNDWEDKSEVAKTIVDPSHRVFVAGVYRLSFPQNPDQTKTTIDFKLANPTAAPGVPILLLRNSNVVSLKFRTVGEATDMIAELMAQHDLSIDDDMLELQKVMDAAAKKMTALQDMKKKQTTTTTSSVAATSSYDPDGEDAELLNAAFGSEADDDEKIEADAEEIEEPLTEKVTKSKKVGKSSK